MDSSIAEALEDWNPWWHAPFPQHLLGFKRQCDLLSYLQVPEIKVIMGARRAGKSTLMYQVMDHLVSAGHHVLYINFQDDILQTYSLSEIYYYYLEQGKKVDCLFIDEIQYCKDWVGFIRKLYDLKELQQLWISGSNSSFIRKEYAELLTGRNFTLTISTLSFQEMLQFTQVTPTKMPFSRKHQALVKTKFMTYLEYGAFPAVVLREVYRRELLQNYFEDFIYKDIAGRYDVNTTKIKELGIYFATNIAKIFSYRKVAAALHIHANTIIDYCTYFKETYLFDELYAFDYSLKNQYRQDKKIYALDTGMAMAVSFHFSRDLGHLLENLVFLELKRRYHEIFFHKKKKECDFIIKEGMRITQAIQVCQTLKQPETMEREVNGLIEALHDYQLTQGFILTLDEEETRQIEPFENGVYTITILPIWKWLLMSHSYHQQ